ncbi:MAG: class III bacteriocin [Clostridiales bacterium]|nr:class III bacteriocin [Clostridiales bacterium]
MKSWKRIILTCGTLLFGCFLGSGIMTVNPDRGTTDLCGTVVAEAASVVKKDKTPSEPANSDLTVVHTVTKLRSSRWIQSFTKDDKYYYFIQMTNAYKGNLRITRVKYKGIGKYTTAKMDLKGFGHGTNLDCSVYNGKTYLWTGSSAKSGSDVSRAISCFRFKSNRTLRKKGGITYKIPKGNDGKYVTNVYPAVSADSSELCVRFTYNGKQYFQIYDLARGKSINVRNMKKQVILSATVGAFQGFDYQDGVIYTIEGSPRKSFLKSYDSSRVFEPTIIRTYNIVTGKKTKQKITGAKRLSFREPEGIEVSSDGTILIMFVSNKLTDQSCNIYQVK